jgi:hypothetical protein
MPRAVLRDAGRKTPLRRAPHALRRRCSMRMQERAVRVVWAISGPRASSTRTSLQPPSGTGASFAS